jgi:hypothetical protein
MFYVNVWHMNTLSVNFIFPYSAIQEEQCDLEFVDRTFQGATFWCFKSVKRKDVRSYLLRIPHSDFCYDMVGNQRNMEMPNSDTSIITAWSSLSTRMNGSFETHTLWTLHHNDISIDNKFQSDDLQLSCLLFIIMKKFGRCCGYHHAQFSTSTFRWYDNKTKIDLEL